jgi:hypothetical protein
MKKFLTIFLMLFAITFYDTFAQAPNTGFGIKAGVNMSNFRGSLDNYNFNWGPMGGVYYRIGFGGDRFTIQPELLYSMLGSTFDIQNQIGTGTTRVTDYLHYVNLPIMAQFWVAPGFNLHIGPYAGVLFSGRTEGRADFDVLANYERWDAGAAAGATYELPFGLNFGARYNLGLTNINNFPMGPTIEGRTTNQFVQIHVGFTF